MPVVHDMPITRLLPNMLTLLSLCSGLTAVQMAIQSQWPQAVIAIVIAAAFDVLDGRVARMLNIASKFGAELDSLSDCVSFGVAPGFVLYLWTLQDGKSFGWIAVLVLAVCSALRLARFNTMLELHELPAWTKSYFTGVPAPAGAGLALLPLFLSLASDGEITFAPNVVALWVIFSGALMVSRLPTPALKGRRVSPVWVASLLMGVGVVMALLITHPWVTLSGLALLYLSILPYSWYAYNRRMRQDEAQNKAS